MLRFARSIVGDAASAERLVQEALIRAFQKRHTFQGGNMRTWLLRIVHATHAERGQDGGTSRGGAVADDGQVERLRRLEAAFQRLPADQRAALYLVTVEGLEYREAAAILGLPVPTLMTCLSRARAALRRVGVVREAECEPPLLRVVGGSDA